MITLSPERERELVEALAEGFTPEALERRVMDPMRVPSEVRSAARDYRTRIFELVRWATAGRLIGELLRAAHEANPNSERLRLLNEAAGLIPATSGIVEAIRPALPLGGEKVWSRGLREVEKQICVVERKPVPKGLTGTGFLVGPDQVMTHASVVANDMTKVAKAIKDAGITVSFDRTATSQRTYRVLAEPLFLSDGGVIVLQLDRPAGRETTPDPEAASSARARGWLAPRAPGAATRALVIVQYVEGNRLVVSIDTDGLIRDDGGLIQYRTSTQPGSMGAPCFDANWRLVGMHVGSDTSSLNHGIGIASIVEQLRDQHFVWDVSSGVHPDATQIKHAKPPGELDALVRAFEIPLEGHDPEDDVWSDDADGDASNSDRWAWAEAAAVTAYFDPEKLVPAGNPPVEARVPILLDSSPMRRADGEARWMLSERVRVRALERLAKRDALRTARAANAGDPVEILDVVLGAFIAGTQPTRAELQNPDRLRAMLQVAGWLARTGLVVPATVELRANLARATLIAPFRHLTRGFFAGRDSELATLVAYVDGPDADENGVAPAPILVHGPGGMGKSALLAHFILAHSERDTTKPDSWRPFVYLDFDRPELDARDLSGVLLAIARQVAPQVPGVQAQIGELLEQWSVRQRAARPKQTAAAKNRQAQLAPLATDVDIDGLVAKLGQILVVAHGVMPAPLVLVVDTLEEVQYATPDAVVPLAKLVVKLRSAVPSLRPVLSGRAEVGPEVKLTLINLGPLPQPAAETLLSNHLPAVLASKTDLVTRMVQIVGGNPLSLRLAAEVLSRETDHNLDKLGEEEFWQRVGDSIVQGQLYERIAGHLHEGPIKQLAIPGLVLRYLTWELIRDVLAGPCGVEVKDDVTAQSLFSELAREIALVRQGGDETKLVLRPELRRTVLDSFRKDTRSADTRGLIHEAAIKFFFQLPGPDNRAEEIYHRLWLDQEPAEIDSRWLTGIDLALRSAVEELDGRARSYLANRVGGVDDEVVAKTTAPTEWEAYAEKRASDLLRLGLAADALKVLQLRADRLPTSRLHLIESIARRSVLNPDLAAAESAANNAIAAARASADPGETQSALQELVQVRRLRNDTEGVLRALAELGNLGEQLGDDLILLQAAVEGLESVRVTGNATERFSESAVRVFSRLPDELVARAPELARRVAAQAGGENPAVLQRVIRLVGVGPLNKQTAAGLERVLASWAQKDQAIESFVPKAPANATDLTSAVQYLLANRSPDSETAKLFSAWFQMVVTTPLGSGLDGAIHSAPDYLKSLT